VNLSTGTPPSPPQVASGSITSGGNTYNYITNYPAGYTESGFRGIAGLASSQNGGGSTGFGRSPRKPTSFSSKTPTIRLTS